MSSDLGDEADLLGDRIAIMAIGKLKCSSSSFFLKNSFVSKSTWNGLVLMMSCDCIQVQDGISHDHGQGTSL